MSNFLPNSTIEIASKSDKTLIQQAVPFFAVSNNEEAVR